MAGGQLAAMSTTSRGKRMESSRGRCGRLSGEQMSERCTAMYGLVNSSGRVLARSAARARFNVDPHTAYRTELLAPSRKINEASARSRVWSPRRVYCSWRACGVPPAVTAADRALIRRVISPPVSPLFTVLLSYKQRQTSGQRSKAGTTDGLMHDYGIYYVLHASAALSYAARRLACASRHFYLEAMSCSRTSQILSPIWLVVLSPPRSLVR